MKTIKARVLRFLTWLGKVFLPISSSIEEVFVEREYEQREPVRAPEASQPISTQAPKEMRQRWDIPSLHKRKVASKLGTVDPEAIVKSSRPSGRKPTRAQRRASATK